MKNALLLLLALCGCAKGYAELGSFVCPHDELCPDGYACVNGVCDTAAPCDPAEPSVCFSAHALGSNNVRSRCTLVALTATTFGGQCAQSEQGENAAGSNCSIEYAAYQPASTNLQYNLGQFYGDDKTCTNGTICHNNDMVRSTNAGGGPTGAPQPVCREFCSAAVICKTGFTCLDAFGKQVLPGLTQTGNKSGVCVPSCTFFTGAGCSAGDSCGPAPRVGQTAYGSLCHAVGGSSEGSGCTGFGSCGAGLHCVPNNAASGFACRALCDGTHPCTASGKTCDTNALQLGGGVGICQ